MPRVEGLYRREDLFDLPLTSAEDSPWNTAVFITHLHLDHMAYMGAVAPEIPVYLHPAAQKIEAALEATGRGVPTVGRNYQDLLPGTRVLMWADDKGQASKVIVFPYEYKGSISLDGYGRLYVNSVVAAEPSALRRPYGDERLYVPIRAVAEAAGYDVSWDKEFGVTVKDGSDILFQICPDTKLAHGPAAADRHSLAGPCLIANGVTYLEAGDLAHLLGMFYGG